jgi:hypothetical protein
MATTDDASRNGQASRDSDPMKPIGLVGAKSPVRPEIPLRADQPIGSPPPRIPVPSAFDDRSGHGVPSPKRFPSRSMNATTKKTLAGVVLAVLALLAKWLVPEFDPGADQPSSVFDILTSLGTLLAGWLLPQLGRSTPPPAE